MKGHTIIIIITTIIIIITSIMGTIQSVPSPLGCLSSGIESYHTRTLLFHLYVDDKENVPQKLKDTNDNICKFGWLKGIKLLTSFLFLENHSESIKQWYILSFPSKWVLKSVIQNSRNGLGVKVRLYKSMQTQAELIFFASRLCPQQKNPGVLNYFLQHTDRQKQVHRSSSEEEKFMSWWDGGPVACQVGNCRQFRPQCISTILNVSRPSSMWLNVVLLASMDLYADLLANRVPVRARLRAC